MGSTVSTLFGNKSGSPGKASYTIPTVGAGGTIRSSNFTALVSAVNSEYARRNKGNPGFVAPSGTISASLLNSLMNYINEQSGHVSGDQNTDPGSTDAQPQLLTTQTWQGYINTGLFNGVSSSGVIYASQLNGLISLVQASANVCLCNCNYCTCNCNYCTCNCNYACTCNCNYSDIRLKENIQFIETKDGLNIYSWNYIKNTTQRYIGVLAQELLGTKYRGAVMTAPNGFYMVNYGMLPVEMMEE